MRGLIRFVTVYLGDGFAERFPSRVMLTQGRVGQGALCSRFNVNTIVTRYNPIIKLLQPVL